MSLNILPLETINVQREVLDIKTMPMFGVEHGVLEHDTRTFDVTSISTSGFSVICDPPSENTYISPMVVREIEFSFTINVANTSGGDRYGLSGTAAAVGVGGDAIRYFAGRPFPGDQVISSEQITLNGATFSNSTNEFCNALQRIGVDHKDRQTELSMAPSMLDDLLAYNQSDKTFKDPFAKFGDGYQDSRAAFHGNDYSDSVVVATADNKDLIFKVKSAEYIKISPLYYQNRALVGIRSFTYNCVFSDLSRAICRSLSAPGGIAYTLKTINTPTAKLKFHYYTPKFVEKVPKQISWNYTQYDVFKSAQAAGASPKVNLNPINLAAVPKKLIIFCEPLRSDTEGFELAKLQLTTTLKYAIDKVNISFGNRSGLLSNMSSQELYNMSVKNGLQMSYNQFAKWVGSVVIIDFANDLGLPDGMAVSTLSNPLLAINVECRSLVSTPVGFDLKYIIQYEGICNNVNGSISRQLAVLSKNDVLDSIMNKGDLVQYKNFEQGKVGGFLPLAALGSLLPYVPAAIKGVRQALKSDVGQSVLKGIDSGMEAIGLGMDEPKKKAPQRRGAKIAGKLLSRNDLMNNLNM